MTKETWTASTWASWMWVGKVNSNDLEADLPDDSGLKGAFTDADGLKTDLADMDSLDAGLTDVGGKDMGRKDGLNGFGDSSTASTLTQGG